MTTAETARLTRTALTALRQGKVPRYTKLTAAPDAPTPIYDGLCCEVVSHALAGRTPRWAA